MKKIFLIFILLFIYVSAFNQQLFYSDIVYGGITSNGATTAYGSGTINMTIQIAPNSTIKKAYLIAARDSLADDITVTLNGINYTFSNATIITNGFNAFNGSGLNRPNSSMHLLDITSDIDSSITNYSLVVTPQPNGLKGFYSFFYLYIVYENLFLNTQNVAPITIYNLSNLSPFDANKSFGLAVTTNYFCDTILDGSYVDVNGNNIGVLGGEDFNSNIWTCAGTYANFAYYNDSLFGLDDDTPDSLMGGTDALADIKSYVNNGDTTVNVTFTYQTPSWTLGKLSNPIRAVMLTYTTPCDTFTTTITPNDTICLGDSIQLQATGGVQYAWFGAFGGLSDTSIANPMASPPQTTTYIVTITNDSGCVKTEQVKIWVMQPAVIDSISTAATICGSSTGSITTYFNGNFNFTLLDSNATVVSNNTTGVFTQLPQGNYILQSTTSVYGCTYNYYDTLNINYVNLTHAAFIRNPWQGKAPLTVNFTNISSNANQYVWLFPADTFYTQNLTYTFDSGGVYPVCLIAQNNYAYCTDTACYTFIVEGNTSVLIPNVFTPNSDGSNDVFTLQITDADLITNLEVAIYNRWGEKLYRYQNNQATATVSLWNGSTPEGKPAPEGTYFYVLTYTTIKGEVKSEKGTVTLLR